MDLNRELRLIRAAILASLDQMKKEFQDNPRLAERAIKLLLILGNPELQKDSNNTLQVLSEEVIPQDLQIIAVAIGNLLEETFPEGYNFQHMSTGE